MKYDASRRTSLGRTGFDEQGRDPSKQYGCLHRVFSKPNKNIVPPLMHRHNNGFPCTTEISDITRLKIRSSGSEYLK